MLEKQDRQKLHNKEAKHDEFVTASFYAQSSGEMRWSGAQARGKCAK
jgi:hypothetical protein